MARDVELQLPKTVHGPSALCEVGPPPLGAAGTRSTSVPPPVRAPRRPVRGAPALCSWRAPRTTRCACAPSTTAAPASGPIRCPCGPPTCRRRRRCCGATAGVRRPCQSDGTWRSLGGVTREQASGQGAHGHTLVASLSPFCFHRRPDPAPLTGRLHAALLLACGWRIGMTLHRRVHTWSTRRWTDQVQGVNRQIGLVSPLTGRPLNRAFEPLHFFNAVLHAEKANLSPSQAPREVVKYGRGAVACAHLHMHAHDVLSSPSRELCRACVGFRFAALSPRRVFWCSV